MEKTPQNDTKTPRFPSFPSMGSLAGTLGIELAEIQKAKRKGAAGFGAAGRIDSGQLLAWALRRERSGEPKMSLEDARARLAESRAKKIDRDAKLEDGELIDVLWVAAELEKSLADVPIYMHERQSRFAWDLVRAAMAALGLPFLSPEQEQAATKKIEEEVAAEFKAITIMIRNRKSGMMNTLSKGPHPKSGGRTLLAELHDQVKQITEFMSPESRQELTNALLKVQATGK